MLALTSSLFCADVCKKDDKYKLLLDTMYAGMSIEGSELDVKDIKCGNKNILLPFKFTDKSDPSIRTLFKNQKAKVREKVEAILLQKACPTFTDNSFAREMLNKNKNIIVEYIVDNSNKISVKLTKNNCKVK